MSDPVLAVTPLGFPWATDDPFLFCVHHDDAYPQGDDRLAPAVSLAGREFGMDFAGKDGWRMYHGDVVPGFPQHPHRGFETVTLVRRGVIDHSDSLGATARFGGGDAQWLTAGKGIVHSEMFPLLSKEQPNPLELFQLWVNLPRDAKMVEPHFSMLWASQIPSVNADGVEITIVAGRLGDAVAPPPPPHSWASRADADVAIWTLKIAAGKSTTLPPARAGTTRNLYLFAGGGAVIGGREIPLGRRVRVRADEPIEIRAGGATIELLMLQGKPIGEPVAQHGPFVMNTMAEIQQAFRDYQRTQFGGWPWDADGPVHPRDAGRFARHADGKEEKAP